MPTYSYECKSCGEVMDVYHGMSIQPRIKCRSCGKGTKRLIGMGAGIIFKGSGFYETDYKRSGGAKEKGGATEGGDSSSSSADTKSEAKAESKSESKAIAADASTSKNTKTKAS